MTPEEAIALQQQVVDSAPDVFVRACPGAGKTRTVVDRFIRLAAEGAGRSVAVVSFTNRAADEVARRCAQLKRPELCTYPNFVGTLDRFIATYIVRPFGQLDGPIRIVDSWDSLDVAITAFGVEGPVSLDHFEVSPDGLLRFDRRDGDPAASGAGLRRLERKANEERDRLRNEGYLTCDDARAYAALLLAENPEIAQLIRHRFSEIIVDEAQDCSSDEILILRHLRVEGVGLVIVCDPHQSIYSWRDAKPEELEEFVAEMEPLQLTGNWRSSPAICALSATMRPGQPDHAVGPFGDDDMPVHLLAYEGRVGPELGERFVGLLEAVKIETRDAIVLSHASASAAAAVGAKVKMVGGRVGVLAVASLRLADEATTPRERERAFDRVQRVMLESVGTSPKGHSTPRAAELAGLDLFALRRAAIEVGSQTAALNLDGSVAAWVAGARTIVATVASRLGRDVVSMGNLLRNPANTSNTSMSEWLKLVPAGVAVRYSTVHQAKGAEYEAAMMILPRDTNGSTRTASLVEAWKAREALEAKRVLYVGATRAQRLCVIALPDVVHDVVRSILDDHHVPFVSC